MREDTTRSHGVKRSQSAIATRRNESVAAQPVLRTAATIPLSDTDQSPKRRINTQHLAVRLGPDLIKELESLLKPGVTEMPSFAVRSSIQKRYGVDRRHVYDWFHNKGLRVAKRKSTLPSEATDQLHLKREKLKEKNEIPYTLSPVASNRSICSDSTSSTPPSTPIPTTSPGLSLSPLALSGNMSYEAACYQSAVYPAVNLASTLQYFPPEPLEIPSVSLPDSFFLPHTSYPVNTCDTVSPSLSLTCDDNVTSLPQQQLIDKDFSIYWPFPSGSLDSFDPFSRSLGCETSPQQQREAFYQYLSKVLPPAYGIEESVGTYKAFMNQQNERYYQRLFSGDPKHPPPASSHHDFAFPCLAVSQASNRSLTQSQASQYDDHHSSSTKPLYDPYGRLNSHTPVASSSASQIEVSVIDTPKASAYQCTSHCLEHSREDSATSCLSISDVLETHAFHSRQPSGSYPKAQYGRDPLGTGAPALYYPPFACYGFGQEYGCLSGYEYAQYSPEYSNLNHRMAYTSTAGTFASQDPSSKGYGRQKDDGAMSQSRGKQKRRFSSPDPGVT